MEAYMKLKTKALFVLLLVAATFVFVAAGSYSGSGKPTYLNGVYIGKAESHGGTLSVTVTVAKSKIASISVEATDTPGISDSAIEKVPAAIVKAQKVDVDSVSGASETSKAIKEAVLDALKGAILYPVDKKVKTDVVVIGGGNAGLAAAVEASNAGAKVILLEKMTMLGGNSIRSGGAFNAGRTATLSAAYRAPLWYIDNGPGLFPVFFHALWAEGFVDWGAGWDGGLSWNGWTQRAVTSVGAQVNLDLNVFWYLKTRVSAVAYWRQDGQQDVRVNMGTEY